MTENSVLISISINAFEKNIAYQWCVQLQELETAIGNVIQEIGNTLFQAGIGELDRQVSQEVPAGWQT